MGGPVQIGGGRRGYGSEPSLFIDGREVEVGEGLLAVLQIVADANEVDYRENEDECDEKPGTGEDGEKDAAR